MSSSASDLPFATTFLRDVPRQRRAIAAVESILEAARTVLLDESVPMSTSSIASQSSVTKGTLYRYFDDVDAIMKTIAVGYAETAITELVTRLEQVTEAPDVAIALNELMTRLLIHCRHDRVARALLTGDLRGASIGSVFEDAVWRLAREGNRTVKVYQPPQAHPHQHLYHSALGYSFVRSVVRLGAGLSPDERLQLYTQFGAMMVRAVDFDPNYPHPVETDPYAAGLLDD